MQQVPRGKGTLTEGLGSLPGGGGMLPGPDGWVDFGRLQCRRWVGMGKVVAGGGAQVRGGRLGCFRERLPRGG